MVVPATGCLSDCNQLSPSVLIYYTPEEKHEGPTEVEEAGEGELEARRDGEDEASFFLEAETGAGEAGAGLAVIFFGKTLGLFLHLASSLGRHLEYEIQEIVL